MLAVRSVEDGRGRDDEIRWMARRTDGGAVRPNERSEEMKGVAGR